MTSYLICHQQGKLDTIKQRLLNRLSSCTLCPRVCRVDRSQQPMGFCRTGRHARVNSFFSHFEEEPELVGPGGSGTIFFSYCNLGCLYCQNYTLSHQGEGTEVDADKLAQMMLRLQEDGAENINFVTPTHVIAQIIEALPLAIEKGLHIPLVYNCAGYESVEVIKELAGIFDLYMPDIKYCDDTLAVRYSQAPDYWSTVRAAVCEMHRQVGDLVIENGIAKAGLLIRHLVLPNGLAGSFAVLDFIRELSPQSYVNIMDQYRPHYRAHEFPELSRPASRDEYARVVEYAKKIGLHRGFLTV
ncbi:MAG: radical SAM protein [Candidatus Omnitrophota bacterium]